MITPLLSLNLCYSKKVAYYHYPQQEIVHLHKR